MVLKASGEEDSRELLLKHKYTSYRVPDPAGCASDVVWVFFKQLKIHSLDILVYTLAMYSGVYK